MGLAGLDPFYRKGENWWIGLFSLKCENCLKFAFGCKEHWFCGLCEPCRDGIEGSLDRLDI